MRAPTPKVGVLTYLFCRKLLENERIWARRGDSRPWRPPWIHQWQWDRHQQKTYTR